tara:strand:+ start:3040 stop:3615 length:576 start_codon:yes stop_codon:yes gene_type:complete
MKQKINSTFQNIEKQREEFISFYDSLNDEQRSFNPDNESWNLLQVMRHIVTAERLSLAYIQRKISSSNNIPKAGLDSWFRTLILQIAFYLPLKYKAPKIAQVDEAYPDFESMKTEWDQVRSGFKELIDTTDSEILEKAIYRHPRAGMMNMKQAVEFLGVHISHHLKQVDRISSHPSFPVDAPSTASSSSSS